MKKLILTTLAGTAIAISSLVMQNTASAQTIITTNAMNNGATVSGFSAGQTVERDFWSDLVDGMLGKDNHPHHHNPPPPPHHRPAPPPPPPHHKPAPPPPHHNPPPPHHNPPPPHHNPPPPHHNPPPPHHNPPPPHHNPPPPHHNPPPPHHNPPGHGPHR